MHPASKERDTILCWLLCGAGFVWSDELQGGGVVGVAKSRRSGGVPWFLSHVT
jgi:hypothetical protein